MVEFPEWYDGKTVNEVKFCEEFLKTHPMKSVNGTFFTVEGRVTAEAARRLEACAGDLPTSATASAPAKISSAAGAQREANPVEAPFALCGLKSWPRGTPRDRM